MSMIYINIFNFGGQTIGGHNIVAKRVENIVALTHNMHKLFATNCLFL